MGLIVQKYGGSSVAAIQHIGPVADRIPAPRALGAAGHDALGDRAGLRVHPARAYEPRVSIGGVRASVSAVGLGADTDADLVSGSRRDAEGAGLPLYGRFHGDDAATRVVATGAEQPAMRLMHERIDAREVRR